MLITAKKLAEIMNVTPVTVALWCRKGYLAGDAVLIGGCWVINFSDLLLASLPPLTGPGRKRGSKNKKQKTN